MRIKNQNNKTKKNKTLTVIVAIALCAVIVIGSTFAWVTSQDTKVNRFENSGYIPNGVTIVEDFDPPTEWVIGSAVDKKVSVTNGGSDGALVRVSFEELLYVLGANGVVTENETKALSTGKHGTLNTLIAAKVDAGKYTTGWTTMTVVGASDVVVKKAASGDILVAYYEYDTTNHLYQGVNIGTQDTDFTVSGTTITFINAPTYKYFTAGVYSHGKWHGDAASLIPALSNAAWDTAFGQKASSVKTTPLTFAAAQQSQLDNGNIKLVFGTDVTSTITAGKWYYNAADGFFYYIGVLAGGSFTPLLLEQVKLPAGAGGQYNKVDYHLGIICQALQADSAALTDTLDGGWGLATNDPVYLALAGLL